METHATRLLADYKVRIYSHDSLNPFLLQTLQNMIIWSE